MAFTIQQLVDRARIPLNDSDKDRYTDTELLGYAQDAYLMLRKHRPDILLGNYTAPTSWSALTLVSTFPYVDDEYLPVIAEYITARAEFKDDEHVVSQRAQAMMAMFTAGWGAV